jgi:hypothetical protein
VRDLIEESRKARARKARNGHDRQAERNTVLIREATDLFQEAKAKFPGESVP